MSTPAELEPRLRRHAALRWIGVGLFVAALPGACVLLANIVSGQTPAGRVMNVVLALGVSLGAFGTNNDTAVHAMRELDARRALPAAWAPELAGERARRAAALAEVHDSPRAGLAFPWLAAAAVAWLYHRAGLLP